MLRNDEQVVESMQEMAHLITFTSLLTTLSNRPMESKDGITAIRTDMKRSDDVFEVLGF